MPKYEYESHILGGEVSKFFQENNIGKYGKVERPLITPPFTLLLATTWRAGPPPGQHNRANPVGGAGRGGAAPIAHMS